LKFNIFKRKSNLADLPAETPASPQRVSDPKTVVSGVSDCSLLSRAYSIIFPKSKVDNSVNEKSSFLTTLIRIVLNKKPVSNSTDVSPGEQKSKPQISDQQLKAVKAHLLPLTLFSKLNKLLFGLNIISFVFLMILLFEHSSLYPLVETQYNYAEFISSDHNFVNVVHTKHIDNEYLIESLLRRYVVEREQIIKKPSRIVEKFSIPEVYSQYFRIIKTISEKDIRSKVRRFIKILRYQKIESNIRQIEVEFTDLIKKTGKSESKIAKSVWLINIKFEFLDALRKYNEVKINPSGLMVTIYNIKRQS